MIYTNQKGRVHNHAPYDGPGKDGRCADRVYANVGLKGYCLLAEHSMTNDMVAQQAVRPEARMEDYVTIPLGEFVEGVLLDYPVEAVLWDTLKTSVTYHPEMDVLSFKYSISTTEI